MLRYELVVLLYAVKYCMASEDTPFNGLSDLGKSLQNANGNLTPARQIIYLYGPDQWKTQGSYNIVAKAGSDYLFTPGMGGHKLHVRRLSWNKARRTCIEEGGHLAIINSASEEKILLQILMENNVNEAWLGVHDLYEEGDWTTVTDEPLEATGYSRWTSKFPNEPDNFNNEQHCGLLLKEGGMDDIKCTDGFAFFCEISF